MKNIYFILFGVFLLYFSTINYSFLEYWDNPGYSYTLHPIVKKLNLENVGKMFTREFDNHYHPITLLSLAIDNSISNGDVRWFRFVNMVIYLLITFFIFLMVKLITQNNLIATVATSIYAFHPFNVESMLWISERKNLLFMLFGVIMLYFYVLHKTTHKDRYLYLGFIAFLFSLLSKSQGLPLLLVLFLIDFLIERKISKSHIIQKLPFLIIVLVISIVAILVHRPESFIRTHPSDISDYIFTGFRNYLFYIYKTMFPIAFSPYYAYPENPTLSFIWAPFACLILFYLIWKYLRKEHLFFFGFLFYSITIFPLLKFFPIPFGNYIAADRYMILPLLGLSIAFSDVLVKYWKYAWIKIIGIGYLILIIVSTYSYQKVWKNSETFYTYLTTHNSELVSGWGNRGRYYLKRKNFKNAIADFSQAIKIKPKSSNIYVNRGLAYAFLKHYDSALYDFSMAIRYDSSNIKAYINRSMIFTNLKKYNEALNDINAAITIQPIPELLINKAYLEYLSGDYKQAYWTLTKVFQNNNQQIKQKIYELKKAIEDSLKITK